MYEIKPTVLSADCSIVGGWLRIFLNLRTLVPHGQMNLNRPIKTCHFTSQHTVNKKMRQPASGSFSEYKCLALAVTEHAEQIETFNL